MRLFTTCNTDIRNCTTGRTDGRTDGQIPP